MAIFSYVLGELDTASHSKTIINHILTLTETQQKSSFSETQCVYHLRINVSFRSRLPCTNAPFAYPELKHKNIPEPFPASVTLCV